MLTPWVNPVTAGKNMANRTQNPGADSGAAQFPVSTSAFHRINPPTKKETSAAARKTITTYWNRVAQSAPSHARTKRNAAATPAMIWGIAFEEAWSMPPSASPNPACCFVPGSC